MKSYLEQALAQVEQKIENGDFRRGLGKLEDACWNVTLADSVEKFDQIRGLAERVAERTDGRLAKKARALIDLTEERRTAHLEGLVPKTATVPVSAHDKPRAGCGVVVLGTFVGIVVGLAAFVAVFWVHDLVFPPAPLEFFPSGSLLFLAIVIGLVIGVCVGVLVASACRRLANR